MYLNSITNNFSLINFSKNNHSRIHISEGLASGKRINRASDDAANSAISQRMTSQINGLKRGIQNSNEGISLLQTFDSSLSKVEEILQRMREISIQSSNGTFSDSDRANLDSEFQQLSSEIDRISSSTKYNGHSYFGNDSGNVDILLSDDITDTLAVDFKKIDTTVLFSTPADISNQLNAQNSISSIDNAIEYVINYKSDLGAYMNRLESNISELNNATTNLSSARSGLEDLDMANAISEYTKNEILTNSSISMLNKVNQMPNSILKLMS